MINLRQSLSDGYLNQIAHEWYDDVAHFLNDNSGAGSRKGKAFFFVQNKDAYKILSNEEKLSVDKIFDDLTEIPDKFILADRNRIDSLYEKMHKEGDKEGELYFMVTIIKDIFKDWYTDFIKKVGYKYTKKLNIRTCPYCNRNYTFTIDQTSPGKFKTRPEFDHFYDKSNYPLLALSFYNLVPSCPTCNHAKSTKNAGINPFFEGFHSRFFVTRNKDGKKMNVSEALCVRDENDFSIGLPEASNAEKENIGTFGINELYNEHKDYVMEIIDKSNAYNAIGAQNLIDAFQGLDHSPKDVFDFVWGGNLEESEFLNRPLSKLTHDILLQVGINKQ